MLDFLTSTNFQPAYILIQESLDEIENLKLTDDVKVRILETARIEDDASINFDLNGLLDAYYHIPKCHRITFGFLINHFKRYTVKNIYKNV